MIMFSTRTTVNAFTKKIKIKIKTHIILLRPFLINDNYYKSSNNSMFPTHLFKISRSKQKLSFVSQTPPFKLYPFQSYSQFNFASAGYMLNINFTFKIWTKLFICVTSDILVCGATYQFFNDF